MQMYISGRRSPTITRRCCLQQTHRKESYAIRYWLPPRRRLNRGPPFGMPRRPTVEPLGTRRDSPSFSSPSPPLGLRASQFFPPSLPLLTLKIHVGWRSISRAVKPARIARRRVMQTAHICYDSEPLAGARFPLPWPRKTPKKSTHAAKEVPRGYGLRRALREHVFSPGQRHSVCQRYTFP